MYGGGSSRRSVLHSYDFFCLFGKLSLQEKEDEEIEEEKEATIIEKRGEEKIQNFVCFVSSFQG